MPSSEEFLNTKFEQLNKNAVFKWYDYFFENEKIKHLACADDLLTLTILRPWDKKPKYKNWFNKINNKCASQRFRVVTIDIVYKYFNNDNNISGHRNVVIIDNKKKEFELFEPNGSQYTPSVYIIIEKVI